jgi:hypothetical protein
LFDHADEDEDGEGGGLLGLLEPPKESTSDGRAITLREMNLPKHSSGRTPKSSLKECVAKLDKYAAITYTIVSGSSRAVRASVSILWEGRRRDDWTMEDVACLDEAQAEQYIATIALHALTFPPTDGFAAGNVSAGGSQTFFRSLPPAFRDLWDELEAQRKESEDTINRALWTKLRTITADKYAASSKASFAQGISCIYSNILLARWKISENTARRWHYEQYHPVPGAERVRCPTSRELCSATSESLVSRDAGMSEISACFRIKTNLCRSSRNKGILYPLLNIEIPSFRRWTSLR